LRAVLDSLEKSSRVVLTTHVNADGDGTGSEVAMALWLKSKGIECWIVNPTRFPPTFEFLLRRSDLVVRAGSDAATEICASADRLLVLDTGETSRIGRMKSATDHLPKTIIDHHVEGQSPIKGVAVRDETACATGELVYDLLLLAEAEITPRIAQAIYVAILTDTGSFRFSNSTPEAHRITAELIEHGAEPERIYERVYGSSSLDRYRLLAASLAELEVDEEARLAWMTVPAEAYDMYASAPEDLDGFVDYPRSVRDAEVGLLFRTTQSGDTKVSFRSRGRANVNEMAREFGGGGHAMASGALVGGPVEEARPRVLEVVRRALRQIRTDEGRG